MRIVCISDTHERHDQIDVPDGDLLIHAGDISMRGSAQAIRKGFAWLSSLSHRRILFIPGNHDFAFQRTPTIQSELAAEYPRVEVLIDSETLVDGHRVYGSPWQPWFRDWAFNFPTGYRGTIAAEEKWDLIPADVEILITHGPVRYILDRCATGEFVGCTALRERVRKLPKLCLHVCGHIHESYGTQRVENILYVNAASCDLQYRPTQKPIVVDFQDNVVSLLPDMF